MTQRLNTKSLVGALEKSGGHFFRRVVIPAGAEDPTYEPEFGCVVWGVRGQVVNGPGTSQVVSVQKTGGLEISSVPFDTDTAALPGGEINGANAAIAVGQAITFVKAHNDQTGWLVLELGFGAETPPTPPA